MDYLVEYLLEEIAVLLHLHANAGIPIEVHHGPDLPVMRKVASGLYPGDPFSIPERTHIAVELTPNLPIAAAPSDLPEILEVVRAWPTHFVPAAIPMVESDFTKGKALVWKDSSHVVGFAIWDTDGNEMELKWLAVAPRCIRRGIGSALVRAFLDEATTERRAFLLTATTDSSIPGTDFNASLFHSTHHFFANHGFRRERRLDSLWSPTNHADLFVRDL